MTDPYRALCAELVDIITAHANPDDAAVGYVAGVLTRARALLAEPVAEGPTDDEIEEWADACPEAPLEEMDPEVHGWRRCFTAKEFSETIRAALARWGRPAAAPVPEPGEVPRIGHILRLAEIIREVDGRHDKGAAALAEAILSHPGICSAGLAALDEADGPAVPDGREPASVALQPSDVEVEKPAAWMCPAEPYWDGKEWRPRWQMTRNQELAEWWARPDKPTPLFAHALPTPEAKP